MYQQCWLAFDGEADFEKRTAYSSIQLHAFHSERLFFGFFFRQIINIVHMIHCSGVTGDDTAASARADVREFLTTHLDTWCLFIRTKKIAWNLFGFQTAKM